VEKFLADWRNPALAVGSVLIIFLLWATLTQLANGPGGKVVRIADRVITDGDIVKTMKNRIGDQMLSEMIVDNIVDLYAAGQHIEATDSDINQVLDFQKFQAQLRGESLEDEMAAQGISLDELKKNTRTQVLLTKLVVPSKDIAAELKRQLQSGQSPYALPARYRYRVFQFANMTDAQKSYDLLQKPNATSDDVAKEAATFSTNPAEAVKVLDVIPDMLPPSAKKQLAGLLHGLKDGQCSKPKDMGMGGMTMLLQLVESVPVKQPTMENSNILIGKELMNKDKRYQQEILKMESKAMDGIDVQFYTTEYARTQDRFKQTKKENPNIPMVNSDSSATSQPSLSTPPVPTPPVSKSGK